MRKFRTLALVLAFLTLIAIPNVFANTPEELNNTGNTLISPNTIDWGNQSTYANTPTESQQSNDEAIVDKLLEDFNQTGFINEDLSNEWVSNLHWDITYYIARDEYGFSDAEAQTIADGDNNIDYSYPLTNSWHFNDGDPYLSSVNSYYDTRNVHYRECMDQAIAYNNAGNRSMALYTLGNSLHPKQDIFAHGNVQTLTQHNSIQIDGVKVIDNYDYDVDFNDVASNPAGTAYWGSTRFDDAKAATRAALANFIANT